MDDYFILLIDELFFPINQGIILSMKKILTQTYSLTPTSCFVW